MNNNTRYLGYHPVLLRSTGQNNVFIGNMECTNLRKNVGVGSLSGTNLDTRIEGIKCAYCGSEDIEPVSEVLPGLGETCPDCGVRL